MKRLLLFALLMFHAASAAAADKWIRVQSRNFTLVGNATENQIKEVAEGLEIFRTAFSKFFVVKEGASVATTVTVFRSDQAFRPFKPLYQGKPANLAGYFQPGQDMNTIALTADIETPRVIYHEYVHRLMADTMASQPPWVQEGFAECFSTLEIEGRDKKVRLGRAIAEHVALLNERRFMPLEKLFAVEDGSPEYNEEEKQGIFYAESWALVHYMMFDTEQRRTQFMSFLTAIGRGTPAPKAFQEIFNMELSAFQKIFEAYIQQRSAWNLFQVQTPGGLDRSKEMASRVMTEAEAEAHLGDLLLRLGRLPDAEKHLAASIKLDQKLGSAQSSMGRLNIQKGNRTEALPYLKRATELDANNYLSHYYYAALLRDQKDRTDSDRDIVKRELQRSIELAPQFVEAMEMLASENISRNIDIVPTIELLIKALGIAPGRDFLTLQLASALSRTQQRENARPLAQNLLVKPGVEPAIRQNAQSLLTYLDRAAAVDNANRAAAERLARADRPEGPAGEAEVVLTPPLNEPQPPALAPRRDAQPATADRPPTVERPRSVLPPGTASMQGVLTLLDCRDGLTLSLTVDGKTVKFLSTAPQSIKFTSYNPAVSQQIACGPTPGTGIPAVVIYEPRVNGESVGNPVAIDFVASPGADALNAPLPTIPGTSIARGLLTLLDCSDGVTFSLTSEGRTLRFRSASAGTVAFVNGPNADGTVTCGPQPGSGLNVTVVYRPTQGGGITGEPVIVQFQRN